MQTAWQDLIATASEGSILDDTGKGKASILGAVLTSQRLLLVSATLQVLAAMSIGSGEAAVTSILWMGPALLFCTSDHQVHIKPSADHVHVHLRAFERKVECADYHILSAHLTCT